MNYCRGSLAKMLKWNSVIWEAESMLKKASNVCNSRKDALALYYAVELRTNQTRLDD